MISRRALLSGLAASTVAGCSAQQSSFGHYPIPVAPPPPDRATLGLDAVIDLSRFVTVTDFRAVRQSNILGVIHKATEGGDYVDPACATRRPAAEAAGLLWGAYHFGTGQSSGARRTGPSDGRQNPAPRHHGRRRGRREKTQPRSHAGRRSAARRRAAGHRWRKGPAARRPCRRPASGLRGCCGHAPAGEPFRAGSSIPGPRYRWQQPGSGKRREEQRHSGK